MIARELVYVPLEARLRPASLVVPAGLLLGQVGERLQTAVRQPEQETPFAVDQRDDRPVAAPQQRDERLEEKVGADADAVGHGLAQRVRAPGGVEPRGEDRQPLRPVALELVREVVADPLEIGLETELLVVPQLLTVRQRRLLRLVEQRIDLR